MEIKPIAIIKTDFEDKFGIPRQSGRVPQLMGRVVFLPEYRNPDVLRGIEGFSHLWLIFDFSKAHRTEWSATVRPPRLGGNQRIGVFASRSPFRPNPLGLSAVKLVRVEQSENSLELVVSGVDLLNDTPIYDIKPYLPYADCQPDATDGYTAETKEYRLEVDFPEELLSTIPEAKREAVIGCLAEDPRPSYQADAERIYKMRFSDFDIHFQVDGKCLTVVDIQTTPRP
ncbi:MAG: tRNA (N6-threonylcarbamoyladenosine(37)-N6)-methyltransferase TrmO [Ruminococcaceae bacterium]|nr:tRNA (N6-threonylcarbamoyladenosine(37)-N6)-methyltransferase TrmO [Oscillospiraceae bacterium]